ncbi:MAG: chorismate-binding protein [Chlamydiales bacterium]|nr:chorismate-binding protein [Chlamydiales bacterium]
MDEKLRPLQTVTREKEHLEINSQSYFYRHLSIEIAPVDIPSWLQAQNLFPKVCWMERGGQVERVAVGSLLHFGSIPHISADSHPQVRLYGGRQFSFGAIDPGWAPFPSCAFWLPQFEIVQEMNHAVLHIHFLNENACPGAMQKLRFDTHSLKWGKVGLGKRSDFPPFSEWETLVKTSLLNIEKKVLEKIVIARKTRFLFPEEIDPYALLTQLSKNTQRATVFSFQTAPGNLFLGATPEKLYHREGLKFQTEAIAGTRPRSKIPEEDLLLQQELLENPKEMHEFACVKEFIQAALEPLCQEMHWQNSF